MPTSRPFSELVSQSSILRMSVAGAIADLSVVEQMLRDDGYNNIFILDGDLIREKIEELASEIAEFRIGIELTGRARAVDDKIYIQAWMDADDNAIDGGDECDDTIQ